MAAMEWSDEALVLSVRPHGETAAIAEVFSRDHGRYLGLVHGGRSRKLRPVLQIGNQVDATWRARLADQLGHLTLSPRRAFAARVMEEPATLAMLTSMAALTRVLPERDPHANLYEISMFVLGFIDDPSVWPALYVRWEAVLLDELGYGLDLSSCAATGDTHHLHYVSPKSGRAVSRDAGEAYRDKLMRLPAFLRPGRAGAPALGDVLDGLALTGFFLERQIWQPRAQTMPEARARLRQLLQRQSEAAVN